MANSIEIKKIVRRELLKGTQMKLDKRCGFDIDVEVLAQSPNRYYTYVMYLEDGRNGYVSTQRLSFEDEQIIGKLW